MKQLLDIDIGEIKVCDQIVFQNLLKLNCHERIH